MTGLQPLRVEQAPAVLAFERTNRSYFAGFISDRGEEFFTDFTARFNALLAAQESHVAAYHVVMDDDGVVLGRFNLIFGDRQTAELGYRVAEAAAGRGLATDSVRELCTLAAGHYGQRRVVAAVSDRNIASQKVLLHNGFAVTGPADPAHLGGKPGRWYERAV